MNNLSSTQVATVNYDGVIGYNATDPYAFTTESRSFELPTQIQILMCLFYGTLAFTAIASNMIVCYIVLSNQRMRTATNYFIVNLAVGDILMALLCIPFTFPANLIFQYWPFGLTLCIIVSYSQANSVFISAYTMVAISIDKYIAIMYPMRLRMPKAQAKIMILFIWSLALITSLPTALLSILYPVSSNVTQEQPQQQQQQQQSAPEQRQKYFCQESWTFWPKGKYYYSMALMILQFILPLFVLVITYSRIVIAVWGKRMPGEEDNARDAKMARSKRKMIKMVIFCVIAFALTWLPFNALIVIGDMHPDIWEHQDIMYIWFITHYLAMCHTITNPLIYIWMNNRFRAGFRQTIGDLYRSSRRLFLYVWYHCCCLSCLFKCSQRKYSYASSAASFHRKPLERQLTRKSERVDFSNDNNNNNNHYSSNNNRRTKFTSALAEKTNSVGIGGATSIVEAAPLEPIEMSSNLIGQCNKEAAQQFAELESTMNEGRHFNQAREAPEVEVELTALEGGANFRQICAEGKSNVGGGGKKRRRRQHKQSHVISICMTSTEYRLSAPAVPAEATTSKSKSKSKSASLAPIGGACKRKKRLSFGGEHQAECQKCRREESVLLCERGVAKKEACKIMLDTRHSSSLSTEPTISANTNTTSVQTTPQTSPSKETGCCPNQHDTSTSLSLGLAGEIDQHEPAVNSKKLKDGQVKGNRREGYEEEEGEGDERGPEKGAICAATTTNVLSSSSQSSERIYSAPCIESEPVAAIRCFEHHSELNAVETDDDVCDMFASPARKLLEGAGDGGDQFELNSEEELADLEQEDEELQTGNVFPFLPPLKSKANSIESSKLVSRSTNSNRTKFSPLNKLFKSSESCLLRSKEEPNQEKRSVNDATTDLCVPLKFNYKKAKKLGGSLSSRGEDVEDGEKYYNSTQLEQQQQPATKFSSNKLAATPARDRSLRRAMLLNNHLNFGLQQNSPRHSNGIVAAAGAEDEEEEDEDDNENGDNKKRGATISALVKKDSIQVVERKRLYLSQLALQEARNGGKTFGAENELIKRATNSNQSSSAPASVTNTNSISNELERLRNNNNHNGSVSIKRKDHSDCMNVLLAGGNRKNNSCLCGAERESCSNQMEAEMSVKAIGRNSDSSWLVEEEEAQKNDNNNGGGASKRLFNQTNKIIVRKSPTIYLVNGDSSSYHQVEANSASSFLA